MSAVPISQVGADGAMDANTHKQSNPAPRLFEFYMRSALLLRVRNFQKDQIERKKNYSSAKMSRFNVGNACFCSSFN